ncbi:MAG: restriction endonuclease, partial [Deltaproteobacteria bacterium]|nr:restriction endonuclease [Deltaproteobacteria bacterium]
MDIPKFQDFYLPMLKFCGSVGLADCGSGIEAMTEHFSLSAASLSLHVSSGKTVIRDRVAWALTYLFQAGLLERPSRGRYRISAEGRKLLAGKPETLNDKILMEKCPQFRKFKGSKINSGAAGRAGGGQRPESAASAPSPPDPDTGPAGDELTPDEMLDRSTGQLEATVLADLKRQILELTPRAFEKLILRLMTDGLKYSSRGLAIHTGKPGDGGVDGIITEDALGLDSIYLQAKHYANSQVSSTDIQAFAGAMDLKSVTKGVFVTSGSFSKAALYFADRVPKHIRLISGDELVDLMYRHGIGVRTVRTLEIKRVDHEFFGE